jgi:integrase/recombinase XerD
MKVFADLSDWLLSHGMAAADLRRSDLDRFLRHRRAAGHTRYASIRAVHPVLDYLQRLKVIPRQAPNVVLGPVDVMLDRFWRYLTVERALAAVTARAYLDMVRPFVQGRLSADCRAFERLTAADIICFVVTRCPRQSRGAAKLTVTALRSFRAHDPQWKVRQIARVLRKRSHARAQQGRPRSVPVRWARGRHRCAVPASLRLPTASRP